MNIYYQKMHLKKYLFLLCISLSGIFIYGNIQDLKHEDIVGSYTIVGFNFGVKLELKSDNNFVFHRHSRGCMGGGDDYKVYGTFVFERNQLTLFPENMVWESFAAFNKNDESFYDSLPYHETDSNFFKTKMQVVQYDSSLFLLSETNFSNWGFHDSINDFETFANMVNSGIPFRYSLTHLTKPIPDNLKSQPLDISLLPAKYQRLFLSGPIQAEIIDIHNKPEKDTLPVLWFHEHENLMLVTFNKGSKHGIVEKMVLYGGDECCTFTIISVEGNFSYGKLYYCQDESLECTIGTTVSTNLMEVSDEYE